MIVSITWSCKHFHSVLFVMADDKATGSRVSANAHFNRIAITFYARITSDCQYAAYDLAPQAAESRTLFSDSSG
jgi:Ni,Fe-hydrogenase III large subunit